MQAKRFEISRLVAAAVVSPSFCKLLLSNPAKAIEDGWNGETFDLTPAEHQLVCSIRASTVQEFAEQLVQRSG